MKILIGILFILFLLTGCEKIVDLDYKANTSSITIEGNITNAPGPHIVKITKSVGLSETTGYPTVDNAIVLIRDSEGNTEQLLSQGKGTYTTTTLAGVEGRTYTLSVICEGETYTAQSTMPLLVPFDSIKISEVSIGGDIERNLIPVYRDPVAKGNNYRFVFSLNGKLVNQHLVQNDQVLNGVVNTAKLEINDDDLEMKSGDEIRIEMQSIDHAVSLFYTTLALIGDSGPGGGITPGNPPSNISNGALGIFSAHTTQSRRVTVR